MDRDDLKYPVCHYAFFFDIDGTLAELKPTPEEVDIPAALICGLQQLFELTCGAVALVSGRPLCQIDQLFAPFKSAAAGVHGAELRLSNGEIVRQTIADKILAEVEQQLTQQISSISGVRLERKPAAFALHYRQSPHSKTVLQQLADRIVTDYPQLTLQAGKFVWELKPAGIDKGRAISSLMATVPFCRKIPVFLGDDITDEKGFFVVNQLAGISVKVGEGKSAANYRLNKVSQVHQLVRELSGLAIHHYQPGSL